MQHKDRIKFMPQKKSALAVLPLTLCFLLIGCSPKKITPELMIRYQAVHSLNPDINNRPSPVVVTVYQLQNKAAFLQSSFYDLYQKQNSILGASFIDSSEIEIRPAQQDSAKMSLWPNTRYIGITAAYRNISNSKWRIVLPVPEKKDKIKLSVFIGTLGISANFAK